MAILDAKLSLSDAQALSATDRSEGQLDLGAANLQIGAGTPLYLNIRVNAVGTGSGTGNAWTIGLYTHDASMSEATGSEIVRFITTVAGEELTAGLWIYRGSIPLEVLQQFVALRYTETGTATATIDAWISLDAQSSFGISAEI